jgi:hypothetical protein
MGVAEVVPMFPLSPLLSIPSEFLPTANADFGRCTAAIFPPSALPAYDRACPVA